MKKQVWIVSKNGVEVTRVNTKKMAEIIAHEINGTIHKYTKE